MSQYPARIRVTELDGTNGFVLTGEMYFQYTGEGVASADINGDGFDDVIIGAPGDGASGVRGGTTYVVFGQASGFGAVVPLSTLNGTNGFKMVGGVRGYSLGLSVASAGDVNGDGIEDMIVGAPSSEPYLEGAAYVIYGTKSPFSANFDLTTLDGTNGFKLIGPGEGQSAGWFVEAAGDVNGDGFDDVIATTYPLFGIYSGQTYVVFGAESGLAPTLNLANLNGANGFQFVGPRDGMADRASSAGDINGDGFDDVIVGQYYADASYVIYGKSSGFAAGLSAASLNGLNGFEIAGAPYSLATGYAAGAAGDINGDGYDDFFVGVPDVVLEGTTNLKTGATYVVFGTPAGFPGSFSLSSINATNGFKIRDETGYSSSKVYAAGDMNADGFDDIAISFHYGHDVHAGKGVGDSVCIVFGRASGIPASIDLSSLDGSNGFTVDIRAFEDPSGPSIASGDVNGDGFSDLIVGVTTPGVDTGTANNSYFGATYVVFGLKPDAPVIRVGTAAGQTLAGGDFSDTLVGLAGQDQLFGNGGDDRLLSGTDADTLTGGSGQDIFAFASISDLAGDLISDFDPAFDLLDLRAIQGLAFIGNAGFSNVAGQMNYVHQANFTLLQIDSNGDGNADAALRLNGNIALSAADFQDSDYPTLLIASPPGDATGVALGTNIILTFNRAVAVGSGNIEIRRSSDAAVVRSINVTDASQVTFSASTVTINPSTDLLPGTSYYVAVGSDAIRDGGGQAFQGIWSPTDLNFTTEGVADTTAPTLVDHTPGNNAANVAIDSDIVLTFSEPVQPGSGNIAIYHDNNGLYGGYLFAGISASDTSQVTFSGSTVTINPNADLFPGHNYYVLINPGVIEDAAGNDFAGIAPRTAFKFSTAGAEDLTRPSISVETPATSGAPVDTNFIFTANEPVQPGGAPFQIRLVSDSSLVTSISALDTSQVTFAGNTVTLNPSITLQPGTAYKVSYDGAIVDLSGNSDPFIPSLGDFTFTTAGVGDTTAPVLVNSSISPNAADVPVDVTLTLTFSEPVKLPYQGGITFQSLANQFSAVYVGLPDPDYVTVSGNTVTITLPRELDPNTQYQVRFGTKAVADLAGNSFNSLANNFQFTTGSGGPPEYAGDYTALLSGLSWNEGIPQAPAIITYSFDTIPQAYDPVSFPEFTHNFLNSFQTFSFAEMDFARAALAQWADVSGIIFLEATPGLGDIQFGKYDFDLLPYPGAGETEAFAYIPTIDSDAALANSYQYFRAGYAPDGQVFYYGNVYINTAVANTTGLLLHEIGHAIGLKHPFEGSPILDPLVDDTLHTVMSYTGADPSVLGPLDVAAVQYLYGMDADDGTHVTSWSWNADVLTEVGTADHDTIRGVYSSNVISGLAGNDLLVGGSLGDSLDGGADEDRLAGGGGDDALNGGPGNDVLSAGPGDDHAFGGHGSDLQIGEAGNDTLLGGLGDDTLKGHAGNDMLDGGAGLDTAVFSSSYSEYSITQSAGQWLVAALSGMDGADTLRNIERLVFYDQTVNLSPPPSLPYPSSDFNGDGKADIFWQNSNGLPAVWLLNGTSLAGNGEGSNPGPGWHAKGAADFNGDGKADMLWQHDNGGAAVWLFDGTTQIGGGQIAANPGAQWHVKGSGDFNGDGKSDILWQHDDGRAAIWLMNGASILGDAVVGSPGSGWRVQGSGDFNGDGRADILWQKIDGQASLWFMNGTTQRGGGLVGGNPGAGWHAIGSADFNGDALADILWQNEDGQAAVWLIDGTAQLATALVGSNPGARWRIKGTGDANADGNADILWQNDGGQAAVWFLNGTSFVGGAELSPNPGTQWHIANFGFDTRRSGYDFDADGKTDFLWQNVSGEGAVWLLNGMAHIGGNTLAPNPGASWKMIDSGDFNADGRADILWQSTNGEAAIWLMDGSARLAGDGLSPNPGAAWHAIGTGDFNGDGKADILWQNENGAAAIWFIDGTTRVGGAVLSVNPGPVWHVIDAGDFNGDGKPDILWQHDDGRAAVWLMDGPTKLSDAILASNPGPTWHAIGTGDFNGDGKSDILWQNDDGRAAVWLMNGTTEIGGNVVGGNPGPQWNVIDAGDFNSDGKADIKWQNDDGRVAVWLMDGIFYQTDILVGVNPGPDWHLV